MRKGDLIVNKHKLKPWKCMPSLIVETHVDPDNWWKVRILNPVKGLVDVDLENWELATSETVDENE